MLCFQKPIADSFRSYLSSTRVEETLNLKVAPEIVDCYWENQLNHLGKNFAGRFWSNVACCYQVELGKAE